MGVDGHVRHAKGSFVSEASILAFPSWNEGKECERNPKCFVLVIKLFFIRSLFFDSHVGKADVHAQFLSGRMSYEMKGGSTYQYLFVAAYPLWLGASGLMAPSSVQPKTLCECGVMRFRGEGRTILAVRALLSPCRIGREYSGIEMKCAMPSSRTSSAWSGRMTSAKPTNSKLCANVQQPSLSPTQPRLT